MVKFSPDQDELLSQIRHDLKNSLSTIKLHTYLISKKAKEKGLDESLEQVKKIDDKIDEVVEKIGEMLSSKK